MQFLDKISKSYQIVLSAPETANKLPWDANSELHTSGGINGQLDTPISQSGTSNGTTAVTVVSAPPNHNQQIRLRTFMLTNADTAQATVLWQKVDGSTTRTLMQFILAVNDSLQYNDTDGWQILDSSGEVKSSSAAAQNIAQSIAVSAGQASSVAQSTAGSQGTASSVATSAGLVASQVASSARSTGLPASQATSTMASQGLNTSTAQSVSLSGGLANSQATSAGLAASAASSTAVSSSTQAATTKSIATSAGLVASIAQSAITSGNV